MLGRLFIIGMRVLLVLVALSSSASIAQDSATEFDRPVIGAILPFSSAFEDIAFEQQRAINLALSKSDVPVKIIFKDGGTDKEGAVKAFHELAGLENRLLAVISCSSWASDAIHPLAAEKGIFHMAIGSAAFNRTYSGHTVRFTLGAADEQQQLAEYLSSFEKIAIMAMDNDLGNSWISHIRHRFPDRVAAAHVYDPQKMDIRAKLAEIQTIAPDALVLISAGEAAEIARQARKSGITSQFIGTRPIERPELLVEPEYTNGLLYTYPSYNTDHEFSAMYRGKYGNDPGFFGSIISRKVYNFPVEMFVVQKDGLIVYDINEQKLGKNVFLDPLYQKYPSLLAVARRIAAEPDGRGRYRFLDKNMREEVVKNIVWTTVGLLGTEYRLALAFDV